MPFNITVLQKRTETINQTIIMNLRQYCKRQHICGKTERYLFEYPNSFKYTISCCVIIYLFFNTNHSVHQS